MEVRPVDDAAPGGGEPATETPAVVGGCVNFLPGVSGGRLGFARLGNKRAAHRELFKGARLKTRPGTDRYCIAGGGTLRIGYPNERLNRGLGRALRRKLKDRAVLILTSSRRYELAGIAVGSSERALRRRLRGERSYRVGQNLWYLAASGGIRQVFKTRGGKVLEVGIAHKGLTGSAKKAKSFLRAWEL